MINDLSQTAYLLLLLIFLPLPYGTDRRINRFPWVTCGLIFVNALILVVFVLPYNGTPNQDIFFNHWGIVPRRPNGIDLWTYMFLHVSVMHLAWNCAFLWLFGPSAEDALGHAAYGVFYLAGGLMAGLLHAAIVLLFAQNSSAAYSPLVGASGAISAVVGLFALRFYRSKLRFVWPCALFLQYDWAKFEISAIAGLALWLIPNIYEAILTLFQPGRNGIAYWAHIGGFLFGMTVAEVGGMLGQGMREYLFADAISAEERGDDGVANAVRNFRVLLQRKPDDDEVREALGALAQRCQTQGSLVAQQVISEAYTILLEQAIVGGDIIRSQEWLAAFNELSAADHIPCTALVSLADKAAKSGDFALGERLYLKAVERFPSTLNSEQAVFEAAALRLDHNASPAPATNLLTSYIISGRKKDNAPSTTGLNNWWTKFAAALRSQQ